MAEGARLYTEAGGGEERTGLTGMKKTEDAEGGSGQRAEKIRMDITVVKQEVMEWSDVEGTLDSQWIKQEVEDEKGGMLEVKQEVDSMVFKEEKVDEPEVKEEKVKVKEEVMDWPEVKEEENLEIKQEEMFVGQSIKKEQMVDGVHVKEEKDFPKSEVMDDTQVKEEPPMSPPVGCKRKLAMSR
jgi:hypothetical protein